MRCGVVDVWLAPRRAADLPRTRVAGVRPGTGAVLLTVEAGLATTIEPRLRGLMDSMFADAERRMTSL